MVQYWQEFKFCEMNSTSLPYKCLVKTRHHMFTSIVKGKTLRCFFTIFILQMRINLTRLSSWGKPCSYILQYWIHPCIKNSKSGRFRVELFCHMKSFIYICWQKIFSEHLLMFKSWEFRKRGIWHWEGR